MTTDSNKLLELADKAIEEELFDWMGSDYRHAAHRALTDFRDRLAGFVLSAAQAEREPVAWMKEHGTAHGPTFTTDKASVKAWEKVGLPLKPLYLAPPSSNQAWNDAAETAAAVCDGVNNHDNPMTASDCADAIRSLKRPSQAQEPSKPVAGIPASVSGTGDELPPLPHTTYNGYSDGSEPLYTAEQMRDYARAAVELSRAKQAAQPSEVFDAWFASPYTLALQKSIAEDYVPRHAAQSAQVPEKMNIEAAAKKLAECMDYPWEHMPEQGRQTMREHAQCILQAAAPQPDQGDDK